MKAFSIALYAFNVLDYLFTARLIYGLGFGTGVEANRLIAAGKNWVAVFEASIDLMSFCTLHMRTHAGCSRKRTATS